MSYTLETYTFATFKNTDLQATFYRPATATTYHATLIYLHGGGLIFGQRDDLPEAYIKLLTDAGYGILAIDYLLAPESTLDLITQYAQAAIDWFLTASNDGELQLNHQPYYLFGRSAGAYLALYLAKQQALQDKPEPAGVISLYGYFNLNEASFTLPSLHYLNFNRVPEASIKRLLQRTPIVAGPMEERYPIYLAARQEGNWIQKLIPASQTARDFSLSFSDLKTLPKSFIAAAAGDTDVPVRQSRLMSQHIPEAELHIIEANEHDFDRTHVETLGLDVYESILTWLN